MPPQRHLIVGALLSFALAPACHQDPSAAADAGGTGGHGTGGAIDTGVPGSGGATHPGSGGNGGSGGATDAGVDAGPDAAPPWSPCPPKSTVCAIMPLGDSITEGYRSSDYGGYREPLFVRALKDSKSITFVGSAPPRGPTTVNGVTFPRANEGVGGRRISDISAIIPTALDTNKPNIILLHIGTNDLTSGAASMTSQLGPLLDKILKASPSALLVLARIIPSRIDTDDATIKTYDDSMTALVKARADAGKHIVLVDMYGTFTATASYKTALLYDTYHPNDTGYSKLADVWYAAIKSYLP